MRPIIVLTILLLVSGAAAAQPGPAPGYGSALEYAQDYAQDEASDAGSDPQGYAENKTAPGAVDDEVRHTAYMACWAADDAGLEPAACDAYYTPRGEENAEQECDCNATEPVEPFVNGTANETQILVGNATQFVNATVDDPENATEHAGRFLDAVQAFAFSTKERAVTFVEDIVKGAQDCLGLGLAGGQASMDAVGSVFRLLGDTVQLGAATLHDVARDTGDLMADAGKATGRALAEVGSAVADVARSVKDAVFGLFDDAPADDATAPVDDAVDDLVDPDGLLDPVEELLS